jgi:hypothetical protein
MTVPIGECGERTRQYFGKYGGVVVKPESDELSEENALRGEIVVQVPGILEEDSEDTARPLRVVAMPAFLPGFFFIPDPGAAVWIEFVAGEIDFPIWTGVWYPKDKSPLTTDQKSPKAEQKVIRTTSGHVIQVDDTKDKESITLLHKGGAQVKIDEKGNVLIANEKNAFLSLSAKDGETTLADEHGCYLTLKSDGAVVASKEGNAFIELKDGKAKLVGGGSITLVAKEMVLEGASISLGKGASKSVVLAEEFMTLFAGHIHATAMGPSSPPTPGVPGIFGPAPVGKGFSTIVKAG